MKITAARCWNPIVQGLLKQSGQNPRKWLWSQTCAGREMSWMSSLELSTSSSGDLSTTSQEASRSPAAWITSDPQPLTRATGVSQLCRHRWDCSVGNSSLCKKLLHNLALPLGSEPSQWTVNHVHPRHNFYTIIAVLSSILTFCGCCFFQKPKKTKRPILCLFFLVIYD